MRCLGPQSLFPPICRDFSCFRYFFCKKKCRKQEISRYARHDNSRGEKWGATVGGKSHHSRPPLTRPAASTKKRLTPRSHLPSCIPLIYRGALHQGALHQGALRGRRYAGLRAVGIPPDKSGGYRMVDVLAVMGLGLYVYFAQTLPPISLQTLPP